eukprot:999786-Ditylum_brightwellii.AAC.1
MVGLAEINLPKLEVLSEACLRGRKLAGISHQSFKSSYKLWDQGSNNTESVPASLFNNIE